MVSDFQPLIGLFPIGNCITICFSLKLSESNLFTASLARFRLDTCWRREPAQTDVLRGTSQTLNLMQFEIANFTTFRFSGDSHVVNFGVVQKAGKLSSLS